MSRCEAAPRGYRWSAGRYTLRFVRLPAGWRWGLSDRGRGVDGSRTPFGALFAYLRFRRVRVRLT